MSERVVDYFVACRRAARPYHTTPSVVSIPSMASVCVVARSLAILVRRLRARLRTTISNKMFGLSRGGVVHGPLAILITHNKDFEEV